MGAFERVVFVRPPALPVAGTTRPPPLPAGRQARRACLLLPRDSHMPQPTPIKPGPSSQADAHVWRREHAGSAPSHRGAAAEAGEAAWHHNAAFEQLASRVECLSARIEATRSALGVEGVGLFEGVADALAALKTGIVSVRCAWESDDPWLERLPPRQA